MKKKLNVAVITNELAGASAFFPTSNPSPIEKKEVQEPQNSVAQNSAQKVEQVSKPLSEDVSNKPTTEDIETMTFKLRKEHKTKVNTQIVNEWKEDIDIMAFELKVGKYELVEYLIGVALGKIKPKR